MSILRKLLTTARHPDILYELARYRLGGGVRSFRHGVKLGSFSGFSEFYSCARAVSDRELDFFTTYPFPDGAFFDVGANLGLISLLLAKRFPKRPVHAFEPNPDTFQALASNIYLNDAANICAVQSALSDVIGTIGFLTATADRATCSVSNGEGATQVPCTTLDAYAASIGVQSVAFLKVDVEGHEESVFKGASSLLAERRIEVIYYEVCPYNCDKAGVDPFGATRLLAEAGYGIFRLAHDLQPINPHNPPSVVLDNWVALPR